MRVSKTQDRGLDWGRDLSLFSFNECCFRVTVRDRVRVRVNTNPKPNLTLTLTVTPKHQKKSLLLTTYEPLTDIFSQ